MVSSKRTGKNDISAKPKKKIIKTNKNNQKILSNLTNTEKKNRDNAETKDETKEETKI